MDKAHQKVISKFLQRLSHVVSENRISLSKERRDPGNRETLEILCFTKQTALNELKNLKVEDYRGGPELDRNRDDTNIWKFEKRIKGRILYIKIGDHGEKDVWSCISFHS